MESSGTEPVLRPREYLRVRAGDTDHRLVAPPFDDHPPEEGVTGVGAACGRISARHGTVPQGRVGPLECYFRPRHERGVGTTQHELIVAIPHLDEDPTEVGLAGDVAQERFRPPETAVGGGCGGCDDRRDVGVCTPRHMIRYTCLVI